MKRLIWPLFLVSSAVFLAVFFSFNTGKVFVFFPPYRVDASLNSFLIFVFIAWYFFHFLLLMLKKIFSLPFLVKAYHKNRKKERSFSNLTEAFVAFFEGNFSKAERLARAVRSESHLSELASLLAAKAAHQMQSYESRNEIMNLSAEGLSVSPAHWVTCAEFAIEDKKPGSAIDAIEHLSSRESKYRHVLKLSWDAYEQAEDWYSVLRVLNQIDKKKYFASEVTQEARVRAYRALFSARRTDSVAVYALYSSLKKNERKLEGVIDAAADAFHSAGCPEKAIRLIEDFLEVSWSDRLVFRYGTLEISSVRDRIRKAESWRKRYGDSPVLMHTLGCLCVMESLWGKAEEFFLAVSSTDRELIKNVKVSLAKLYESLGRKEEAQILFREVALNRLFSDEVVC